MRYNKEIINKMEDGFEEVIQCFDLKYKKIERNIENLEGQLRNMEERMRRFSINLMVKIKRWGRSNNLRYDV